MGSVVFKQKYSLVLLYYFFCIITLHHTEQVLSPASSLIYSRPVPTASGLKTLQNERMERSSSIKLKPNTSLNQLHYPHECSLRHLPKRERQSQVAVVQKIY